jgi:hypothetical protein
MDFRNYLRQQQLIILKLFNIILPFPKIVSWRFFKKNLNLNRFNSLHESC